MKSLPSQQRFQSLRALLSLAPSPAVWRRLYALLGSWPKQQDPWLAVEYAEEHLAQWPDRLRFVSSSSPLVQQRRTTGASDSPLWRLFRTFANQTDTSVPLFELANWPEARHWTQLHDQRRAVSAWEVASLAKSPLARQLRHLTLPGFPLEMEGLEDLAFSFPSLRTLDASSLTQYRSLPTLTLLSQAAWAGSLNALALPPLSWNEQALRSWQDETPFPSLQWLKLTGALPTQNTDAFLSAGQWSTLRSLDLEACNLTMSEMLTLLREAPLKRLLHLTLPKQLFALHDIEHFAEMAHLPNLSSLQTLDAGIAALGLPHLQEWLRPSVVWQRLRHLRLEFSELQREGVLALTRAPFYAQLESLDLDSTCQGKGQLQPLWEEPLPSSLHTLRLCDNDLSAKDLHALLDNLLDDNSLRSLSLAINPLGQSGMARLLENTERLSQLRSLNISHCQLTAKSLTELLSSPLYLRLEHLYARGDSGLTGPALDKANQEKGTASPMFGLVLLEKTWERMRGER